MKGTHIFFLVVTFIAVIYFYDKIKRNLKNADIFSAIKSGSFKKVQSFINISNTNVKITNDKGETALMVAIFHQKFDLAKYLIENGSEINVHNDQGFTPLIMASQLGHIDTIKYLIQKGADINAQDLNGATPLMWASFECPLAVVRCLVENGANLNVKDKHEDTALKLATYFEQDEIANYLEKKGAI